MQRSVLDAFAVVALVAALAACGGPSKPPARGVIEADVDGWSFRRYQSVLDVEVWVAGNDAVAHTASYARLAAEKRGRLEDGDVVNAFVTRYAKDDGVLRALVVFARRLAREAGYRIDEKVVADRRVLEVAGGGELWVLWAAPRHVVKIGGRGRDSVPDAVIEPYLERYPSVLRAGALEGPLPGEPPAAEPEVEEPFDPANPRPEWQE